MKDSSLIGHALRLLAFCWLITYSDCIVGWARDADDQPTKSDAQELAKANDAEVEFYEKQVRPLLHSKCYECHSGTEKKGGFQLDTLERQRTGGDSGTAIVPLDPDSSPMIEAIKYTNRDLQMPPKSPLSDAEVQILVEWVRRGAIAPESPQVPDEGDVTTRPLTGLPIDEGRQFWSMRPVADPPIPVVDEHKWPVSWPQTSIDAFILQQLEANGLTPAPPADKRTLLRRVTYDLIGLPATPSEMDAFLADDSPAAFSAVIARLLQSPQYGVRWGRHWLDVARYADSNGLDENLAFGNAWRYRDYVVDAFNLDKPFDRFLVEQIAGDLLPDANRETITATGYLVLGAKVLAEPDREKLMMDTIDEQIDTLGKGFLGVTLGCARCHDHKFDPILQSDYYALAAIFKSTKTFGDSNTGAIKHWHEHNFATTEEKEQLKAVDAAIAEKQKAATSFKSTEMAKLRDQARKLATAYLTASALIDRNASLTEVAEIAAAQGLHPRILFNCRRHLAFHADDPFFAPWNTWMLQGQVDDIAAHYEPLFEAARKWGESKKTDPKLPVLADADQLAAHTALFNNSGFLSVPAKVAFAFDESTLAEYNRLADEARLLESYAIDLPAVMSVSDGRIQPVLPLHIRGSHRNLGEPIARGFPIVMQSSTVDPIFPKNKSGRLELANWMASTQHPLTARVFVNRVWRWHFGRGLVDSTENFGVLGDRPSHPELLDWLARSFMESGWSTKELHRLILTSSCYQMASVHPQSKTVEEIDPENKWLWHYRPQRLDAEQIRDSILFVSGRLDTNLGGKSVPLRNRQFVFDHTSIDHTTYESVRRALYLPIIRNNVYSLFEQFDFPDPTMPTGNRNSTIVAPQALLLMNSELVMDSADQMADQVLAIYSDDEERRRAVLPMVFGRPATEHELEQMQAFMADVVQNGKEVNASAGLVSAKQGWSLLIQSLMMSNEFLMVR